MLPIIGNFGGPGGSFSIAFLDDLLFCHILITISRKEKRMKKLVEFNENGVNSSSIVESVELNGCFFKARDCRIYIHTLCGLDMK